MPGTGSWEGERVLGGGGAFREGVGRPRKGGLALIPQVLLVIVKVYCLGFHYLNKLLSGSLFPVSFSISLITYINYCSQKLRTCMHL